MQKIATSLRWHAAGALLVALAGCGGGGGGEDSRVETWSVDSHERECQGMMTTSTYLCTMTKASDGTRWLPRNIEGFEYQPGYEYTLKVRITQVSNPPADSASETYRLVSEEARVPVARDSKFMISASQADTVRKVDATTYRIHNRRLLTCAPALCQRIDALIGQGAGMLLEFNHQNSPGPMNLLSIKCSAPPANFYVACPG